MYFENVSFCYEFRDYQKRVLSTLKEKLYDNKIHIVAAPGSGKTVLGLEIIKTLGNQCLILVPSISIREQWIERFMQLFVQKEDYAYWEEQISIDIEHPGIITCITYQALFSLYSGETYERVMKKLHDNGCKTICLDESHHLKREWWKALEATVEMLDNPVVISLTATPPYDSDNMEWARYHALCGDIDCEVLTPEMVKKNTLCPYQDHIILSVPTAKEEECLKRQLDETQEGIREVLAGETLYRLMRHYDAMMNPKERAVIFIEEPRFLKALVSYIKYYGMESIVFFEKDDSKIEKVLAEWSPELVSLAKMEDIPPLNGKLLEIFWDTLIHKEAEHFEEQLLEQFTDELKAKKFIVKNKVAISNKREEIEKITRNSVSKMESVKEILYEEAVSLGDKLQMVILTDNIGKEDLSKIETEEALNKMTCVSIFESLRRAEHLNNLDAYMNSYISYIRELSGTKLGLLCGSFAILPKHAENYIKKEGKTLGNTGYYYIDITDSERRDIVSAITKVLSDGIIHVLVGTVSLLGEGWDAPGVNSVVIASTVSSFVQTNQIRGRGLRVDKNDAEKMTNIWHLATLQPDFKTDGFVASDEYMNLVRRFDTMLGISADGMRISNGIERVGLPAMIHKGDYFSNEFLNNYRQSVKQYSSNRELMRKQWKQLILKQTDFSKVRDVAVLKKKSIFHIARKDENLRFDELKKFADGLCKNMIENKMISGVCKVRCKNDYPTGKVMVYLENCTPKESKLFSKYYKQVTEEIVVPRYILAKGFGPWKKYFSVPDYCRNMEMARKFMDHLNFSKSEIIYTRSEEGMKFLFELRIKNLCMDKKTAQLIRYVM